MELLKFEGQMLTDDGGILRRIKIRGDGYTNPNDGAWVDGTLLLFFYGYLLIMCKFFFSYNKYIKLQILRAQIMIFVSQYTSREAVVVDCSTAGTSASL